MNTQPHYILEVCISFVTENETLTYNMSQAMRFIDLGVVKTRMLLEANKHRGQPITIYNRETMAKIATLTVY